MPGASNDAALLIEALQNPARLWTREEVLQRPSPVPPEAGIYGWHFSRAPADDLDSHRLLYVGIAPRHMRTRSSTQNLRNRIRYHFRGNSYGSTLRLTIGCLLGIPLRRVGSGSRLTFGPDGERFLCEWMHEHAAVCWYPAAEPWIVEAEAINCLDLPLNLDQNRGHPFHPVLSACRAKARATARELPVLRG